jgi:hypothetical protein
MKVLCSYHRAVVLGALVHSAVSSHTENNTEMGTLPSYSHTSTVSGKMTPTDLTVSVTNEKQI